MDAFALFGVNKKRFARNPHAPEWPYTRFDWAYFAGGGVTLTVSIRCFQSFPSRTSIADQ